MSRERENVARSERLLEAAAGRDWTGKEFRDKNGEPLDDFGKAAKMAQILAEGMVPFLALGERVHAKGATALNALAVTRPKAKKAKLRKYATGGDLVKPRADSRKGGFYGGSGSGSSGTGGFFK